MSTTTSGLPASTRFVIIGAGFAGAATAYALVRLGEGPGIVLEREDTYGVHASGRNAGLLKLTEDDAVIRALAVRTSAHLMAIEDVAPDLVRRTGGLTLAPASGVGGLREIREELERVGVASEVMDAAEARERFALLRHLSDGAFAGALFCATEGVVDVHALLTHYLRAARAGGFALRTGCSVEELVIEAGRVTGVRTAAGVIRAEVVIDASGAWAGRLAGADRRLPLQPMRRHLFVSGRVDGASRDVPFVWVEGASFYWRGEGDGLLLSPCDETPSEPGLPSTDPTAAELLARKLAQHAPGFGDLPLRKNWACLRTFAPDRRPIVGPDPRLAGLFHVSGLGGAGMMTSAAIGEVAAMVLTGRSVDWLEVATIGAGRETISRTAL
jgi:D-arginine dehydrogenase